MKGERALFLLFDFNDTIRRVDLFYGSRVSDIHLLLKLGNIFRSVEKYGNNVNS